MKWILFFLLFAVSVGCEHLQKKAASEPRAPASGDIASDGIRPGFVAIEDLDPNKKTVCGMTLNSDNEILTFQKHLGKDFQFVELVTQQSD